MVLFGEVGGVHCGTLRIGNVFEGLSLGWVA